MNKVVSLLDGSDKDNKVDPIDDGGPGKHRDQSICDVSFSNLDIWNLVNGWPDDPLEWQPFDCHFNPKQIIKTWIAVGFFANDRECSK